MTREAEIYVVTHCASCGFVSKGICVRKGDVAYKNEVEEQAHIMFGHNCPKEITDDST